MKCFVIIGYGIKPSYATGRLRNLDLNETYSTLIKPIFDGLGIPCYRSIDKNLNGSIDQLMLREIKEAEIVLADISTLNANAMWELGVRHALKPRHTFMICEKEQKASIPFDLNHFVVHDYTHSEEGLPHEDVDRFINHMKRVISEVIKHPEPITDSPVFIHLNLEPTPAMKGIAEAPQEDLSQESLASLLDAAEALKKQKKFTEALVLFQKAKEQATRYMALRDNLSFIITRIALCTYKARLPNELEALVSAKIILNELSPSQSNDIEVLGLTGAICKRLYELTSDASYLENSLQAYEKGFTQKQDYYNGINAVFMLFKKIATNAYQDEELDALRSKADYIRSNVLNDLLQKERNNSFPPNEAIWMLLTIAEAYNYKGNLQKMDEYEAKAQKLAEATNDNFAMDSYNSQKNKIANLNIP